MSRLTQTLWPPHRHTLTFLPLGGCNEVGMNLYLYGYDDQWLMVDLGISFRDFGSPGGHIIMPDPAFITTRAEHLLALVLTHGHEDHIGAIPSLWSRLRCPIYATPFTAELVARKFSDVGQATESLISVNKGERVQLGPFDIEWLHVNHSIVDAAALVLRTPAGTVFHTGDWKLDPDPQVEARYRVGDFQRVGREGVLAVVGDSTNAPTPGHSGSEAAVATHLRQVVATQSQRIIATCFASNVARLRSLALAAQATGRYLSLVGRSWLRNFAVARQLGYLNDIPDPIPSADIGYLPPHEVLVVVTGSQGEPNAALDRIADDRHFDVRLESGDTVLFSARTIPGNEPAVTRLKHRLRLLGANVIDWESDPNVHVAGHAAANEIAQLYTWLRPTIAVPVHGEPGQREAHACIARACGVRYVANVPNGHPIQLGQNGIQYLPPVQHGVLGLTEQGPQPLLETLTTPVIMNELPQAN